MGLMDKIKESAKNMDEKAGDYIDVSKIDSKIRDEQRNVEKLTTELGTKALEALRESKEINADLFAETYKKIQECEERIKAFEEEKAAIKSKSA